MFEHELLLCVGSVGDRRAQYLTAELTLYSGQSGRCDWSFDEPWHVQRVWTSGGPFMLRAPFILGSAPADYFTGQGNDEGKGQYIYDLKVSARKTFSIDVIADMFGACERRTLRIVLESSS